ncbi:MAG TPA: sigma-54-dependent Fis family transcriptional regulator [Gammaproteobacteria bacterium]|nr:sigma-54-dependent Fis family transcriptional regulator [Gammaproteobacteria bacterium]
MNSEKTTSQESAILLISDDSQQRHDLQTILNFIGEAVVSTSSSNWHRAVEECQVRPHQFGAAIIAMTSTPQLEQLVKALCAWEPGLPSIIVGDIESSIKFAAETRSRITEILPSKLSHQLLLNAIHKAKLFHEHFNRLRDLEEARDCNMFRSLVGNSAEIGHVRRMMGQVAAKEVSVLITGESGTGKEVVARNLHFNSSRADKPFIPINCGAIPRELLESELFGHEKGAFTGAVSSRAGRFELADGGTLFLDEIGDMPLSMQIKLLRVLQEKSFERVGGTNTIQTDVRILAATHKDLEQMIESGEFRQDLYYRLNVFPIEMPPLRARAQDVPLLLNELISLMESEGRGSVRFNSGAIHCLQRYPWPGNVRELANLVERMAILYPHHIVGEEDLSIKIRKFNSECDRDLGRPERLNQADNLSESEQDSLLPMHGLDLKEYLANLERSLIGQALDDSGGVVARAASRLHMRRTTLVEKMRKYQMQRNQEELGSVAQEPEPSDEQHPS